MWWFIVTSSYLAIGLVTFKLAYFFNRSKDLAKLDLAKLELEKARIQLDENPYKEAHVSDGSYDRWRDAESRCSTAQRALRAAHEEVDSNVALSMTSVIAAVWPLSLVVITVIGLWKIFKFILFAGGMDRAARKRALKLTADKRAQHEKEKEEARLLEVAKAEGLITEEE